MRDWAADVRRRLAETDLPPARKADIADEIAQHLDEHHRELLARGTTADEAERATLAELERVTRLSPHLATRSRRQRSSSSKRRLVEAVMLTGVRQDIVFAARLFRRRAGVMSLALGGLAAAIGVSTVVFGALNALALRPMGVERPREVVHVHRLPGFEGWTLPAYERLRDSATLLRPEAWQVRMAPASPDFEAAWHESVPIHFVRDTFFETFAGTTGLGRLLNAADDAPGAPVRAVVSHAFWSGRLGGDPAIVGRTLTIGLTPVTIVGVAARDFGGPSSHWDAPAAFWMPLSKADAFSSARATPAANRRVQVIARLRAADGFDAAQAEASAIAAVDAAPGAPAGARLRRLDPPLDDDDILTIAFVLAIVGLLLLMAYANVTNLLLAGATVRRPEMAARMALGASRGRIVRQLLTESVLLGTAAGGLGLLLATWIGPPLTHLAWIPATVDLSPDWRVYLFVALVSAGATLVCGAAAAREALGRDLAGAFKTSQSAAGRARSSHLRPLFIASQAATSILLLVGASLFTRALVRHTAGSHGFDVDRLLVVELLTDGPDAQPVHDLRREAVERLRALPGVELAAAAAGAPFTGGWRDLWLGEPGLGGRVAALQIQTDASYFATLGVRLQRGRLYTDDDLRQRAPVAVVSAALVRRYWTAEDPLGASLARVHSSLASTHIIGVIDDITVAAQRRTPPPVVHVPISDAAAAPRVLVRARADAARLVEPTRHALRDLETRLTVRLRTLREALDREVGPVRMLATVSGILASFTLTLAALGLVGVTAFAVHQRTREIGVRLALGAPHRRIVSLIVRQSLQPVIIGLAAGLLVALLASGLVANVLYGIGPRDPLAVGTAVAALLAAAVAAIVLPATRALRLDPARTLRES
jgi:predicted permease